MVRSFLFALVVLCFSSLPSSEVLTKTLGCDEFLKPGTYKLEADGYCDLPTTLKFKTKWHELAYWFGFGDQSMLYCKNLYFAMDSQAVAPREVRQKFIEQPLGIKLGAGADFRPKARPYSFAEQGGADMSLHILDNFGTGALCTEVYKRLGPGGTNWMARIR